MRNKISTGWQNYHIVYRAPEARVTRSLRGIALAVFAVASVLTLAMGAAVAAGVR